MVAHPHPQYTTVSVYRAGHAGVEASARHHIRRLHVARGAVGPPTARDPAPEAPRHATRGGAVWKVNHSHSRCVLAQHLFCRLH